MKLKSFTLLFPICVSIIIIFFQSLSYYFLQDDWYILNKINQESITSFFKPSTDLVYYRPVGMQLFFAISNNLFGIKPFGYHLIAFTMHLLNTILIFYFLLKLFKDKLSAAIGSFVYGTASLHFMTLSWLALTWNTFGIFFALCALIYYVHNYNKKKLSSQFPLLRFFLLALFSTEFAVIFPIFLFIFSLIFLKESTERIVKSWGFIFVMMAIITILYLAVRFFLFPIPAVGDYRIELNFKFFKTLIWYVLWMFNMPENFKYQTAISELKLSPILLRGGNSFFLPTFVSALISLILFIALTLKEKAEKRELFGSSVIFLLFLLPVLFLPQHTYPYYLTFPIIGLILYLSSQVQRLIRHKFGFLIIFAFAFSWFYSSFLAVSFSRQTHWIPMEQELAKKTADQISEKFSLDSPPAEITIITDAKIVKSALFDQEALKVIFNSNSIKTKYHFDYASLPENKDNLIKF